MYSIYYVTFFYISQTSVSAGKILRMGKGFTIEGVEGYDLSTLFLEAFRRKVNKTQYIYYEKLNIQAIPF